MTQNFFDAVSFYEVLGVAEDASATELRAAYHDGARRLHPDALNAPTDAEAQMAVLNHAYATLADVSQRRAYDQANGLGQYARVASDPTALLDQDEVVGPSSPLSAAMAVCSALSAICIGIGFALSAPGLMVFGFLLGIASAAMAAIRFRQAVGRTNEGPKT